MPEVPAGSSSSFGGGTSSFREQNSGKLSKRAREKEFAKLSTEQAKDILFNFPQQ